MARMLVSGCDPKVIARRLLAIASEDIGNADPRALQITLNAWDVYERLGDKEGNRAIAQAAVFCACAPKSNAVYKAFNRAIKAAKDTGELEVPRHLCNATTKLMEDLSYGEGYRYAHDEPDAFSPGQTYFPDDMGEQVYYEPTNRGLEIKIAEKLKQLRSSI
jgi:putative ATPase